MFDSIAQDLRGQFRYGNTISRLIIVNAIMFIAIVVVMAALSLSNGGQGAAEQSKFMQYLSVNSDLITTLKRPWVLITHMFSHRSLWHFAFNMLMLFWFGRIFGGLIGDRRVLPLYIYGGLMGVLFYWMGVHWIIEQSGYAFGASASVMAILVGAAFIAPDYNINLLLIGRVKLKYIVIGYIVIDLLGISASKNLGGHFGHFGGMFMGWLFVYLLKNGTDLSIGFNAFLNRIITLFDGQEKSSKKKRKSSLKVSHKATERIKAKQAIASAATDMNEQQNNDQVLLDHILDKIAKSGLESLTKEERAFLDQASKEQ